MTNHNVSDLAARTKARQDVAASVRAHMAVRGIKDTELARELGWSQSYASRRTNAAISFSVDDLGLIAAHFDLTLSEIVQMPTGRPGGGTTFTGEHGLPRRHLNLVGRTGLEPVTDGLWVAPVTSLAERRTRSA